MTIKAWSLNKSERFLVDFKLNVVRRSVFMRTKKNNFLGILPKICRR